MSRYLIALLLVTMASSRASFSQNVEPATSGDDAMARIQVLQSRVDELSAQLLGMVEKNEELRVRLAELSTKVADIAVYDGQRYVPNLTASMDKSSRFRKDLYDVTHGTIEVQNSTGRSMELYLNGARWKFPPGVSQIDLPYGPVRARFVYFARNREWVYTEEDWHHDGASRRLSIQIRMGQAQPSG